MDIIKLNDLLMMNNLKNVKVKFHSWNGVVNPLDEYLKNHDNVNNKCLFWRSTIRQLSVGQIVICLVSVSSDIWLLTTIKRVTKELDVKHGINYEGEELEDYRKHFGRVFIKYHKVRHTMCEYYEHIAENLIVNQILPTVYDGASFPGC